LPPVRALVTGATGLLGAHLVRVLLAAGHEVRASVRASSDTRGLDGLPVERVEVDVRDASALRHAAEGCDWMFHAAAVFSYWGYDPETMYDVAETGARNAVDAAHGAGVRRVVLTSSTSVLGSRDAPATVDESDTLDDPDAPDYFVAKLRQERAALARATELGVELVVANPSVFVGPHAPPSSQSLAQVVGYLADPLRPTYPGGANFIHPEDVAAGHLALAERGTPGTRCILCGPENQTWPDFHRMLSELAGLPPPGLQVPRAAAVPLGALMELGARITGRPPAGTRSTARQVGRYFWYDGARARTLGLSARPPLETLADTLAWLLEQDRLPPGLAARLRPAPEVEALRPRHRA
jgi:dihydroflavonol-4-reductase